jgi:hypothetical protein
MTSTLAQIYKTQKDNDKLREQLFQSEAELAFIVKQFNDETFYDDVTTDLQYSANRPSEIVRDMMDARVEKPMQMLIDKARQTLLETDRSPLDQEMREILELEYLATHEKIVLNRAKRLDKGSLLDALEVDATVLNNENVADSVSNDT